MSIRRPMEIGNRVRELRQERDWSQPELARRAGLTKASISLLELGKRVPGADTVEKLAQALDVEVGELFAREPALPKAEGRSSKTAERPANSVLDTRVEHWAEWLTTYNRDRATEERTGVVVIPHPDNFRHSEEVRLDDDPGLKRAWPILLDVSRHRIVSWLKDNFVLDRIDEIIGEGISSVVSSDDTHALQLYEAAVRLDREIRTLTLAAVVNQDVDELEKELNAVADERVKEFRRSLLRDVSSAA
jgi:transcriptional regulator with XRE-family HTH domain